MAKKKSPKSPKKLKKILRMQQLKKRLETEAKTLESLKLAYPEMFRKCGNSPCCQAQNENGTMCSRQAMTSRTYIQRIRCCYLCWQHAKMYGVYIISKLAMAVYNSNLSMDEYCVLYPEECEKMLTTIRGA